MGKNKKDRPVIPGGLSYFLHLAVQSLDQQVAQGDGALAVHDHAGHLLGGGGGDVLQTLGGDGDGALHVLKADVQSQLQDIALFVGDLAHAEGICVFGFHFSFLSFGDQIWKTVV